MLYICNVIDRDLIKLVRSMAKKMPILSITGPRQSGKTTLCKLAFPKYDYVNLESPEVLGLALDDPKTFLTSHKHGLIIDEAHRYPDLFSYIQVISDARGKTGEFILTGSQNFLLNQRISQSLAGRVFITHLLPFQMKELKGTKFELKKYQDYIFRGFFPRLYDKKIAPELFYPSYIQTYLERDVRLLENVSDLVTFQKFIRMAAGRISQLINYSSLANELGIDQKTVKRWFSILESSFIVFFLAPHHANFNKRIVKTPKLYFYDTGLACNLLGLNKASDIDNHWAKGALFENFVIADIAKNHYNQGLKPPLYFWRDNTGNEIDGILESGTSMTSIEIKSGTTIAKDAFKGLNYYNILNKGIKKSYLVYGGNKSYTQSGIQILSWNEIEKINA